MHGDKEILVKETETGLTILKIPLPILSHTFKGLENGWILFSGMNYDGMLTYNLYKDKFFPGVFKYSQDTIHGIIYFEKRRLLVVAGNEGSFNLYRFNSGKFNRRWQNRLFEESESQKKRTRDNGHHSESFAVGFFGD